MTRKPTTRRSTSSAAARSKTALNRATQVLKHEAEAIAALVSRLNDDFLRALDLLVSCQGRVVVTGMGKSGHIGKKISSTLASTGTPSLFLHPAEGIHGDLGMLGRDDVMIALSNSGETEELVRILPVIKRLTVPLICFTGQRHSTLAKYSDIIIDVGVKEEAGPLDVVPTTSTTAALAMGDALAMALMEARGFKDLKKTWDHNRLRAGRDLAGDYYGWRFAPPLAAALDFGEKCRQLTPGCALSQC